MLGEEKITNHGSSRERHTEEEREKGQKIA